MKTPLVSMVLALVVSIPACGGGGGEGSDTMVDPGGNPDIPVQQDPGPADLPIFDPGQGQDIPGDNPSSKDVPSDDPGLADTPNEDQPPSDPGPAEVPGVEVAQDLGPQVTVGRVLDLGAEGQVPVEGAAITFLDLDGNPTGFSTISGAEGLFEIELPGGGPVSAKVSKTGFSDTYQFDAELTDKGIELWIIQKTLIEGAVTGTGLQVVAGNGIVISSVRFKNDQGEDEQVGCATVESVPAADIRYFDPATYFPTTLENASATSTQNSEFIGVNVPPGKVTFKAIVSGGVVGQADIIVFADGVTFGTEIWTDGNTNPTPAGCTD